MSDDQGGRQTPQMRKVGLAAGAVGAVGAVSALFLGTNLPGVPKSEPEAEAPGDESPDAAAPAAGPSSDLSGIGVRLDSDLCAPGLLATGNGCAALSELRRGGQALLAPGALPSRPVTLVHPDDPSVPPRPVDGCESYRELKSAGWGALTSADMRGEAALYRACGLLRIAEEARAMPSASGLDRPQMTKLDLSTVPSAGEQEFGPGADLTRMDEQPSVWELTSGTMTCRMTYYGTADFDGDGDAEHLMEWRLAAKRGSLRQSGFGLIESDAAGRVRFRTLDPFAG